jgi:Mg-chelatase subunit ChlI
MSRKKIPEERLIEIKRQLDLLPAPRGENCDCFADCISLQEAVNALKDIHQKLEVMKRLKAYLGDGSEFLSIYEKNQVYLRQGI